MSASLFEVGEGRVKWVEPEIFVARFAPDCLAHECRCRDEDDQVRLDACCQHGADVDLWERDAIRARASAVVKVLRPEARDPSDWFDESAPEIDADFPSGGAVRTAVRGGGCVFLGHDGRGCALHRAALDSGFAPAAVKPMVCRLYPLAYGDATLGLSDDFARYSCAEHAGGPTVYRLQRAVVADVFGGDAVARLDMVERRVVGRRLRRVV